MKINAKEIWRNKVKYKIEKNIPKPPKKKDKNEENEKNKIKKLTKLKEKIPIVIEYTKSNEELLKDISIKETEDLNVIPIKAYKVSKSLM